MTVTSFEQAFGSQQGVILLLKEQMAMPEDPVVAITTGQSAERLWEQP